MTQEEKQLLLQDLCARLPYGVMIQIPELFYPQRKVTEKLVSINDLWHFNDNGTYIENVKPYLRPMSSMTKEEEKEFESLGWRVDELDDNVPWNHNSYNVFDGIDWLNAHHFDYRGLIKKNLALKAPDDMYK